ncbi:glycoside hydrolase domain-containing protein [Kribbella steppae]|uniref:glycoside hydrolase domain-containing protein n=1 Tax=Kribbella steppae TaxID=2512223 RepID=UPI002104457E|nr:glycoside hydrolase domain-containing protein [Kribbella steppae]
MRQATVQNVDAENDGGCPGQCTGQRQALNTYLAKQYAPQDACHCWGGAAETLENSLADFSLAQWGSRLGADVQSLRERGDWWKNTYDPAVGYQRARKADGTWQPGFTPSTDVGFAQGSSATYTWMVPQDVSGLASLMNGSAVQRLDAFFHDENGNWAVKGGSALRNVFAAIGLFPQTPGRAELLVGSPLFPKVEVRRSNGVRLTIEAPATSDTNQYVQSLALNGRNRAESWLPESFITHGGRVVVQMGAAPTDWGAAPVDH